MCRCLTSCMGCMNEVGIHIGYGVYEPTQHASNDVLGSLASSVRASAILRFFVVQRKWRLRKFVALEKSVDGPLASRVWQHGKSEGNATLRSFAMMSVKADYKSLFRSLLKARKIYIIWLNNINFSESSGGLAGTQSCRSSDGGGLRTASCG